MPRVEPCGTEVFRKPFAPKRVCSAIGVCELRPDALQSTILVSDLNLLAECCFKGGELKCARE